MCSELDIIPKINIDNVVSLADIIRTEENIKYWVFYFRVQGGEYPLTVTFPKLGGVHVQGQVSGYFNNQENEAITYSNENGAKIAKAANGISARFYGNDKWKLELCRKDGSAFFTLDADSLRVE